VGDPSVWVTWVFYSDSSVRYPGAWVDDVVIWKETGHAIVKVDPPEKAVVVNSTFTFDLAIEDARDLGAFEFELTYDHTCVVTATGVALGPFLGSTGRSVGEVGPELGTGIVTYGAHTWGADPGPDGDGDLATITFQAGANTCSSDLHLQNVTVTDTAGNEQDVQTEDGKIIVKAIIYLPLVVKDY
jgi:hypothetical protein